MVRVSLLPGRELSADLTGAWVGLTQTDSTWDNPFLRPEFTQSVAQVRPDVSVVVLEANGSPVGFLPFQRSALQIGSPVGGCLSGAQALVVAPGIEWNACEVVRKCRLAAWRFDHLLASQAPFLAHHRAVVSAPHLDLSRGFDAYRQARRDVNSQQIDKTLQKARKLEREIGPLRLETHLEDRHVLETLIAWKSQQLIRTGKIDLFRFGWTRALLHRLLEHRELAFSPMLSAIYAGDRLAAVLYSLRSRGVVHAWFTGYNREFARYSPGLILFVKLAQEAQRLGIERIEIGKGPEPYKRQLMTGATLLAEGAVTCNLSSRAVLGSWRAMRSALCACPPGPKQVLVQMVKPLTAMIRFG